MAYSERQLIKDWIKAYGFFVCLGIMLVGGLLFGWNVWQQRQMTSLQRASELYVNMIMPYISDHIDPSNIPVSTVKPSAEALFHQYPDTPYAQIAALLLAKSALEQQSVTTAMVYLRWVIAHGSQQAMRQIARLRLARVLITMHQPAMALSTLAVVEDPIFQGLIAAIQGDAYRTLKDQVKARQAYQQAHQLLPPSLLLSYPFLQMKVEELG